MKTSSTLFEPSERSISTTTIREGVLSESLGSSPVFKNGHGVCCDPDLIKRCLDHDSDEDVVPTRQQLPPSYPMAHVHVAVDPSKYPYSYHGWVTTLSRKRRKRMAAKARAALKKMTLWSSLEKWPKRSTIETLYQWKSIAIDNPVMWQQEWIGTATTLWNSQCLGTIDLEVTIWHAELFIYRFCFKSFLPIHSFQFPSFFL